MRYACSTLFVLLVLAARPFAARAQEAPERLATVAGHVVEAGTGAPLAGVHVFLAATMVGTTTDVEGRYLLSNVPPGAHKLVASMLGFATEEAEVFLTDGERLEVPFRLEPQVLALGEVAVEARRDRRWQRRLRKFERHFIGETERAADVRILNPEVLRFSGGFGKLVAHTEGPLLIENTALGYRIRYHLKEFIQQGGTVKYDGEPFFEELTPSGPEEAARWAENRRAAFYGSFRHFMLAALAGRTDREVFVTYLRPTGSRQRGIGDHRYAFPPREMLADAPTDTTRTLDFPGHLEILYLREEEAYPYARLQGRSNPGHQRSYIALTDGPTQVDHTGEVVDPYGVTVYGYFAYERVAEELPREYRPEE